MVIEKLILENSEEGSSELFHEVARWMRRNGHCKLWEIELGFHRAFFMSSKAMRSTTWAMAMRLYIEGAE